MYNKSKIRTIHSGIKTVAQGPCNKKPVWITILNNTGRVQVNILPEDVDYEYSSATSNHKVSVKWSGSTLSWYGSSANVQMNALNASYYIIAFCPLD